MSSSPHYKGLARSPRTFGPDHLVRSLWKNRSLAYALTVREIQARYRGSIAGPLWYVIQNLCLLVIYSFVFGEVFKFRWPTAGGESGGHFATSLFMGLILFNVFSEAVSRAPSLILSNANYVKNVVFPIELLSVVSIGTALFNAAIGVVVLIALALVMGVPISLTILWLPLVFAPIALFSLGASWFLSAFGVYVRDTAQLVSLLVTGLMFFSPVFYPATALPEAARWLMYVNPLSIPIEEARNLAFGADAPHFWSLSYAIGLGVLTAYLGWVWLRATRSGFADVL